MSKLNRKNQRRSSGGSILILAILIITCILLPLGIFFCKVVMTMLTRTRYQNCMQSAALLAAGNLSKIVINDPNLGFISLSNQPPIGKATLAQDGEPCPVRSINNCLGTVRLDMVLAHKVDNASLCTLVDNDYDVVQKAQTKLQSALQGAIAPKLVTKYTDLDGNEIKIYQEVQKLLKSQLQLSDAGLAARVRNIRVSLGWVKDDGTTNTPVPQPIEGPDADSQSQGLYKSCIDIPTNKKSFYFAPVAKSPTLVEGNNFKLPDGKRFCSVVKVEADVQCDNILQKGTDSGDWLHVSACAVPEDAARVGSSGAMVVFFPGGLIPKLDNFLSMLGEKGGEITRYYQSASGDLNADPQAYTVDSQLLPWRQEDVTSERIAATALYSWLKGAGTKPRIDSTIQALSANFANFLQTSNIVYEFDHDGRVVTSSLPNMPLPLSVVSDQQLFVEARNQNYMLSCYDNVFTAGTINGGKHAGQPLEGDPINWCDLAYYGLDQKSATIRDKGTATGLQVENNQVLSSVPGGVSNTLAEFGVNHKKVTAVPRKTYYSGGLAVELSISAI